MAEPGCFGFTIVLLVLLLALLAAPVAFGQQADAGGADADRLRTGEVVHRIETEVRYPYVVALPPEADTRPDQRWPVVVDLHGSGTPRLDSLRRDAADRDPRFIWVLPRSERKQGLWNPEGLAVLVAEVLERYPGDRDRVIVMGYSMGGYGAWDFAMQYPGLVAGIVPMAGAASNPVWASRLRHTPVWAFHGAHDEAVPIELAEMAIDRVRQAGGDVRFTVYPDVGHLPIRLARSNPDLYEWMLQRRRTVRGDREFVDKTGTASRMAEPPTIDGDLGRGEWAAATRITGFMHPRAGEASIQTIAHLGWDEEHLYVAASLLEPAVSRIRAAKTGRDANVWEDDSFEVLIDADGDRETYVQFVVNANGALYDGRGFDGSWDAGGVTAAAGRVEDAWEVELAIPWKALNVDAPKAGDVIRMLLARTRRVDQPRGEVTQWPPTNAGNHTPQRFAPITLTAE